MTRKLDPCTTTTQTKWSQVMKFKIKTSCGQSFEMTASEMSDWQIRGLLNQNEHRTDVEPAGIAALRAELARRSS